MNLRGIARLAVAAAATTLLIAAFGAPAMAEGVGEELPALPVLDLNQPTTAADAPTKGCAGIDKGEAVVGFDGWLFGKPEAASRVVNYTLLFGDLQHMKLIVVFLDETGTLAFDLGTLPDLSDLKQQAENKISAQAKALRVKAAPELPSVPGVHGALTEAGGGWVTTPAGWLLIDGLAATDPELTEGTFPLIRACLARPTPTPSASASHAAGGGQLPVTGTNVWVLGGIGVALVVAGTALFVAYRRRRNLKFVA